MGGMSEPVPFTFIVGPRDNPKTGVSGTYQWHYGEPSGWRVEADGLYYQAPNAHDHTDAILEFLHRWLGGSTMDLEQVEASGLLSGGSVSYPRHTPEPATPGSARVKVSSH